MDETNERVLTIATAPSRTSRTWRNQKTTWPKLMARLKDVTRTGETTAEYRSMPKSKRDERKDIGGFVGGELIGGRRRKGAIRTRDLLTLDLDYAPKLDTLSETLRGLGWSCVAYPTHSSTEHDPRYRVVVPLSRGISSEEYEPLARMAASKIGINYMDSTTYEPERLMYWPSVPQDADATVYAQDGDALDADEMLAEYTDWHDASLWPVGKSETVAHERVMKKLGDPREKKGIVGDFCRAYTCREAMEKFIPDAYAPCIGDDNRFTYTKGSTTGGAILYDDDLFLCSHHDTDPAGGGHEVNAFDLVRLHLYGERDTDADREKTDVTKTTSYRLMAELANNDEKVKEVRSKALISWMDDNLIEQGMTPEEAKKVDKSWIKKLEVNKAGQVLPTQRNVLIIMRNDMTIRGIVGRDEFADRLTVIRKLPWEKNTETGRAWQDADDSSLRNWFTDMYGIAPRSAIEDGVAEMAEKNKFHPVRDWLKTLEWDGIERAETFFIDMLRCEDTEYTRALTRVWLKQAIARIKHPGIKADITLVLSGPQGIGKGFVLSRLGGKWFSDSLTSIKGKEGMVSTQGAWIIEMGEMQAMTRSENEEIKAFLTRQVDKYRPPYGKRVQEFPRQCVFAATTNDEIMLKDRTGGRRFGILMCQGIQDDGERKAALGRLTDEYMGELWAEVQEMYDADPSLLLPDDIAKEAERIQEEHTEGAEKKGLIQKFLETPRPPDWDQYDLDRRRDFINNEGLYVKDKTTGIEVINEADTSDYVKPDKVCVLEILCEVFGMDKRSIRNLDVREINTIMQHMEGWKKHESKAGILRFSLYGIQRAYVRESN